MPAPDHYSSMTDDQLAEWHALTVQREKLAQQLELMTHQRDDAVAALLAASVAHDAAMAQWRAEFDRHLSLCNDAMHTATRARNQLASVARVACPVLLDWLATYEHFTDSALTPDARERRKEITELLPLLEGLIW